MFPHFYGILFATRKDRNTLIEQSGMDTLIEQSQHPEKQCSKLRMAESSYCQQAVTFFFGLQLTVGLAPSLFSLLHHSCCKLTLMFILFSSILKMWNSLPGTVIEATNIDFKKRVLKHFCINLAAV